MSIAATTNSEPARSNPLILPLIAATGCAALADWLFYGWWVGISLALFYGVISAVAIAVNGVRAQRRVQFIMTSILLAGLIKPRDGVCAVHSVDACVCRGLMRESGVRISLGWSTTEADIERLLNAWNTVVSSLLNKQAA